MKKGFTLVELAVVMTIIGLLIGGILKGQEMLENSRVTTTMAQMKSYEGAFSVFRDKYGAMPGDYSKAVGNLCETAVSCANGNGNGIIGTTLANFNEAFTSTWTDEPGQTWNHLLLANLIKGVKSENTALAFGVTNPWADVGGGFIMVSVNQAEDFNGTEKSAGATGVYAILRNTPTGASPCSGATPMCTLTPARASQMDRKMDDGVAFQGTFRAYSVGGTSGCGWVAGNGDGGYNESIDGRVCDVAWQLGG